MIDPVLQQMIAAMAASGFALPDPMTPASMRALMDRPTPGPEIPVAEVRDVEIAGGGGADRRAALSSTSGKHPAGDRLPARRGVGARDARHPRPPRPRPGPGLGLRGPFARLPAGAGASVSGRAGGYAGRHRGAALPGRGVQRGCGPLCGGRRQRRGQPRGGDGAGQGRQAASARLSGPVLSRAGPALRHGVLCGGPWTAVS